jgi:putative NIF3 family GTP cyclohydrolase 1 type 2
MTTIREILDYVAAAIDKPLDDEEGVRHGGSVERSITGATVCWMAAPEAIQAAAAAGHELLIGHESLYFPYNAHDPAAPPTGWFDWPVNRQRRELLDRYDLTYARLHWSLDVLTILEDFALLLGLGAPVYDDRLVRIYEIPPCTVGELVTRAKLALNMPALRVSAPRGLDQVVHRVGLPWGGLGLFVNVGYQQSLISQGCDVFIAGESDNYGFRFAAEAGIAMIETSHEVSENPGLRRATKVLAAAFPDVDFQFHELACAWEMR